MKTVFDVNADVQRESVCFRIDLKLFYAIVQTSSLLSEDSTHRIYII